MKRYWKIGFGVALLVFLVFIAVSKETPPFVKMEVEGVRIDAVGQGPVVILVDKEGAKALPIWIGLLEANAIDKELKNITSTRPMTHDLLQSILTQAQVNVKEVRIVDLRDNTYYATLYLKFKKGVIEVDARPSDAIVLALKSKTPIYVSTKILNKQGIALSKEETSGERYGIRVQELTPALASNFDFKGKKGVLVAEVLPGSISETSGIKPGDIIIEINSKEVGSVQEFEEIFETVKTGNSLKILLFRDEKFTEITLSLKP
jgi:bifunctional DNase/RNase